MSDINRIAESRAHLTRVKYALRTLEDALVAVESNVGQPPSSRIPALDYAARAALGVDITVDELAVATCWLTSEYRQRLEEREIRKQRADAGGVGPPAFARQDNNLSDAVKS